MPSTELAGILEFLRQAEQLKNTTRSSFTSKGRRESVAEHTWRLCLMALVLEERFPEVDFATLVKMCLVHDLGEALRGDIPAPKQDGSNDKAAREYLDLLQLLDPLPEHLRDEMAELWEQYETAATPEAKLAKALDKLETILQHNQGKNPDDFDYRFNLEYGKQYTTEDPRIAAIREILDRETEQRAQEKEARE